MACELILSRGEVSSLGDMYNVGADILDNAFEPPPEVPRSVLAPAWHMVHIWRKDSELVNSEAVPPRRGQLKPKRKFYMCKFVVQGKICTSGDKCAFAHARDELATYKAKLCKSYTATGSCSFGDNCLFAHGVDDLRTQGQNDVPSTVCGDHVQGKLSPLGSPRETCSTASSMGCKWSDVSVDSDECLSDGTLSVTSNGW